VVVQLKSAEVWGWGHLVAIRETKISRWILITFID
jgi:hypothetical protein